MGADHNFWAIRRAVTDKPAFVGLGARRNVSLCEARFSAPHPPPDNYCTSRLKYVTGGLNLSA